MPNALYQAETVARSPDDEIDHPGDPHDHRDRRDVKPEQIDLVEPH
jgi:hypothetical protein